MRKLRLNKFETTTTQRTQRDKMKSNKKIFKESKKYIPGGVNSPVRAFRSVGGIPIFIKKAKGSKLIDVRGKEYIDYVCSWGPLILGHAHPKIVQALKKICENGTSYGAPTEIELKLAKLICNIVPSIEKVRMVNSGTEATMSAIRLARAYTKKDKIIKFAGCYHGHSDGFLIKAGSGLTTLSIQGSPGVTKGTIKDTLNAKYNHIESVKKLIQKYKKKIAAVIIEPVVGNMGVVLPKDNFLRELREITANENIILIFDEVITGFRVALGGAQSFFHVVPDLTTLGKIIGGGLPVGAYGGKRGIMDLVAPNGPVYQAGTLSGNPLAMTAGFETIKILMKKDTYKKLDKKGEMLEEGIKENFKKLNLKYKQTRIGSMSCLFFTEKDIIDYQSVMTSNTKIYAKYFHNMLKRGIYLAPSQFEASFISLAHTEKDIEKTIKANYESLKEL